MPITTNKLARLLLAAYLLCAAPLFLFAQEPAPLSDPPADASTDTTPATSAAVPPDVPSDMAADVPATVSLQDPCLTDAGGEQVDPHPDAWIDRLHSGLYRMTCTSASWFDGLFGNRRYDEEYRATHGSVTMGTLYSERDSFEPLLRFKARLYLPQLSSRFNAFIGRTDRDDFLTETQSDLYSLPETFNRNRDDSVFLGLGYNDRMTKRGSFDADAGVRLDLPLDPYIKGSYRYTRPLGRRNLLRLRETIFWQNSEGFGSTALVEWNRVVGRDYLLRWGNSGTFSEESDGVRWYSNLTMYQLIDSQRAFAYELAYNGSTDRDVPVTDYGVAVIYRQRVWRDWLLVELRSGVDWPRFELTERRRANLNAGISFELRFGNNKGADLTAPREPPAAANPESPAPVPPHQVPPHQ
jgi:hypothetical protein